MSFRTDISVDWELSPRIITVATPSTEITMQDLADTLRGLEHRPSPGYDVFSHDYIVDLAGKEPLGGGVSVGITLSLKNAKLAFESRTGPSFTQCNVSGGNLVAFDTVGAELDPIQTTAYVQVVRTSSSSATLQDLEAIQFASFGGGVSLDTTSSTSGTTYPAGNQEFPVNNITDALTIANSRGFSTLFVIGDATLDSGSDLNGFTIKGESMARSDITIQPSALASGCIVKDCRISGTLDGDTLIERCIIDTLTYVEGSIIESAINGTVTLGGTTQANFFDCWSNVAGTGTPTIDIGGSGRDLGVRNYNGGLKLQNKTGADDKVSVDLNSGQLVIDSSVTAGQIVVRGIGNLSDNSVGATVIADNLISEGGLSDAQDAKLTTINDELEVIEGTASHRMMMRMLVAATCNKLSMVDNGDGTYTMTFRDMADTKDRITATGPLIGGRTSVTQDMS